MTNTCINLGMFFASRFPISNTMVVNKWCECYKWHVKKYAWNAEMYLF